MLEVIGVGFGRTGTLSLKRALETLGYRRCYHFREMLKRGHAHRWLRIADNEQPDWSAVFADYRATTDWPAAAYWRELAAAYPEARLILTVRDADDWYDSVRETIWSLRKQMPGRVPGFRSVAAIADRVVWQGTFAGRADDRDYAIERYLAHIDEVQRAIPPERLLVFDVREGWAPLCEFLGAAVPGDAPFPRANDRRSMRRAVRILTWSRYLLPAAGILATVAIAFACFTG